MTSNGSSPYLSWRVWAAYVVLLLVGVPWYWPADDDTVWVGLPAWVVVAVIASAIASFYTATLLRRRWPGEAEESES